MLLNKFNYCALLKTTDAELKGFRCLSSDTKDLVLPAFELTRSRRSRKNVDGSIYKRVDELKELMENRPFILDLTTHSDLQNPQIASLFSPQSNFKNWRNFLSEISIPNLIPSIHVVEDASMKDIVGQAKNLSESYANVAFRVDARDENTLSYLAPILSALQNTKQLIVLIDAELLERRNYEQAAINVKNRISEIRKAADTAGFVCLSSSFPASVAPFGDTTGEFPLYEVLLSNEIIAKMPRANIIHGDYALIHPKRYEAMMAGWVPRIDVPLDEECFYYRYRRENGGYIEAASDVVQDSRYMPLGTWGDDEIIAASQGNPNGRSPSHWISTRVNLHITRQTLRTET